MNIEPILWLFFLYHTMLGGLKSQEYNRNSPVIWDKLRKRENETLMPPFSLESIVR
ncbi:MAG: hypothetical protein ACOCTU_03635 [Bacteroidota bacterium]